MLSRSTGTVLKLLVVASLLLSLPSVQGNFSDVMAEAENTLSSVQTLLHEENEGVQQQKKFVDVTSAGADPTGVATVAPLMMALSEHRPARPAGSAASARAAATLNELDLPPSSRVGSNDVVLRDFVGHDGAYSDELLRLAASNKASSAAAVAKLKVLGALQRPDGGIDWAKVGAMEALQDSNGMVKPHVLEMLKKTVDKKTGGFDRHMISDLASSGKIPYGVAKALMEADKLRQVQESRMRNQKPKHGSKNRSRGVEAALVELDEANPDPTHKSILSGAITLLQNPTAATVVPELVFATKAHDIQVKKDAARVKKKAELQKKRQLELKDLIDAVKAGDMTGLGMISQGQKNNSSSDVSIDEGAHEKKPVGQKPSGVGATAPELGEGLGTPPPVPQGPTQAEIVHPTFSAEGREATSFHDRPLPRYARPCKNYVIRWMCVLESITARKKMMPKGSVLPVPGVQFIGQGFDAITGDNRAPVLKFINEESPASWRKVPQLSIIAGYEYPVGVFCDPVATFKDESTEQTITNSEQAEKHSSMKFGLKFLGGMMSMSKSSSKTRSSLQENYINIVSKVINLYKVSIEDGRHGPLDPSFIGDLKELPFEYQRRQYQRDKREEFKMIHMDQSKKPSEPYRRFIQRYGTHYTSQVQMGGSITLKCETEKSSAEESSSSTMKAEAEVDLSKLAGMAGAAFAGPAAVMVAKQADLKVGGGGAKSSFNKNKNASSKTTKKVTIEGGDPPLVVGSLSQEQLYRWYYSISENPAVMSTQTIPIIDLIHSADGVNKISELAENFRYAYDDFYADAGILAALKDSEASHQYKVDQLRKELDIINRKKEELKKNKDEEKSLLGAAAAKAKKAASWIMGKAKKLIGMDGNQADDPVAEMALLERNIKEDIKTSCIRLCDIKAEVSWYLDKLYGDDFGDADSCKLACSAAAGETLSAALGMEINTGLVDETVKTFMTVLHQKKQGPIDTDSANALSEITVLHLVADTLHLSNQEKLVFKAEFAKLTSHTLTAVMRVKCDSLKSDGQLCPAIFEAIMGIQEITPDCTPVIGDVAKYAETIRQGDEIEVLKLLVKLNPRAVGRVDKSFPEGLRKYFMEWGKPNGRKFAGSWKNVEEELIPKVFLLIHRLKMERINTPGVEKKEPEECADLNRQHRKELTDLPPVSQISMTLVSLLTQHKTYEPADDHPIDLSSLSVHVWVSPYQEEENGEKLNEIGRKVSEKRIVISEDVKDKETRKRVKFMFNDSPDSRLNIKVLANTKDKDTPPVGVYSESISSLRSRIQASGEKSKLTAMLQLHAPDLVLKRFQLRSGPVLVVAVKVKSMASKPKLVHKFRMGIEDEKKETTALLEEYHRGAEFLFGRDDRPTDLKSYQEFRGPKSNYKYSGAWASDVRGTYDPTTLLQEKAMTRKSAFRHVGHRDTTIFSNSPRSPSSRIRHSEHRSLSPVNDGPSSERLDASDDDDATALFGTS